MVSNATFRIDGLPGLQDALAKFPKATFDEMKKATTAALVDFETQMAPRMARGRAANSPAQDGVSVRTGTLRRGFRRSVVGHNLPTLVGIASLGTKYSATLEAGDLNRFARTAKHLAIPLPAARTGAGVPRALSPFQFASGGSATVTGTTSSGKTRSRKVSTTGPNPTFVKRARAGQGYVMYLRQGRDAAPIPIYRLKPNVSIPGHLGFFRTWRRGLPIVEATFARALARVVHGMGRR